MKESDEGRGEGEWAGSSQQDRMDRAEELERQTHLTSTTGRIGAGYRVRKTENNLKVLALAIRASNAQLWLHPEDRET